MQVIGFFSVDFLGEINEILQRWSLDKKCLYGLEHFTSADQIISVFPREGDEGTTIYTVVYRYFPA